MIGGSLPEQKMRRPWSWLFECPQCGGRCKYKPAWRGDGRKSKAVK